MAPFEGCAKDGTEYVVNVIDRLGRVTALIFWSCIGSTLALLAIDRKYLQVLRSDWRMLGSLIALTILWRLPPNSQFFHGLEYEDSYVYSVVAKAMALG